MDRIISSYVDVHAETWANISHASIYHCVSILSRLCGSANTLWLAGNGGSMSTASHASNDFTKTLDDTAFRNIRSICLNDLVATHSAWSNDSSFDAALKNLARGLIKKNDVVMVFSGSGNSKNVIELVEFSTKLGVDTIALTGFGGGEIASKVTCHLNVPVYDMQITEDLHLSLVHLIMRILKETPHD
jgi:D-sedoheptulose 7-phosphate isomerase